MAGRALLVDGDGTVRALARVLLEGTGWRVRDVDDGDMRWSRRTPTSIAGRSALAIRIGAVSQ
jgi:CheY-like chemotaxis protein